jgi:uncharacterized membrane protein
MPRPTLSIFPSDPPQATSPPSHLTSGTLVRFARATAAEESSAMTSSNLPSNPSAPMAPTRHPRRGFLAYWDEHPGVRSGDQLTLGERAADRMRNTMGSWAFVGGFILAMALWAIVNSVFWLGGSGHKHGFDPYPYILLNLMLSMIAGLQGAILLIAAKRSDQIASELAQHDFDTDRRAFDRIEAVHSRLEQVARDNRELLEENTQLLEQLLRR